MAKLFGKKHDPEAPEETAQDLNTAGEAEDAAAQEAEDTEEEETREDFGTWLYGWLQAMASAVLLVVLLFTFFVRMIGVDGHSMLQTLQDGDRLLILNNIWDSDYHYGDIVVLRKPTFLTEPIVKRVIATEGQEVDIDFDHGNVYVDGELLVEDYINEPPFTAEGMEFPLTVPEGSIFVMGDNRNGSSDSRHDRLGTVDTRYVLGRAVFLLAPGPDYETGALDFSRIGFIERLS